MEKTNKIPTGNYDGYYWMSDATKPVVLRQSDFPSELKEPDANKNPFIIEAQLFDKGKKNSISVKYIDGAYVIKQRQVSEDDITAAVAKTSDTIRLKRYYSNRMDENKELFFLQYWRETTDDLCNGKPVLQPAEMVFIGFEDPKNNESK